FPPGERLLDGLIVHTPSVGWSVAQRNRARRKISRATRAPAARGEGKRCRLAIRPVRPATASSVVLCGWLREMCRVLLLGRRPPAGGAPEGTEVIGRCGSRTGAPRARGRGAERESARSEEHTSELQSRENIVCRL